MGSLSKIQQSLVIGNMLGDGYMRCKTNAHLQVTHSIAQRDYVDWKYQVLKTYVNTPPKSYRGNGKRIGYRFFTRSLPLFTPIFRRFYSNGVKVIPSNLKLDQLSLAVWFMDDGSKSRKSLYLNTQQFSNKDQNTLQYSLKNAFGLSTNLDKDKKYYRIRFSVNDSKKLIKIIGNYVIPSMQYKILI